MPKRKLGDIYNYFIRNADTDKASCKEESCEQLIIWKSSNLKRHLGFKHPELYKQFLAGQKNASPVYSQMMKTICRICRASDNSSSFISMFGSDVDHAAQLFQLCGITIEDKNDFHPAVLCPTCTHDLEAACRLQNKAIESDDYFQQFCKSDSEDVIQIVKQETGNSQPDLIIKDLCSLNEDESGTQWEESNSTDEEEFQDSDPLMNCSEEPSRIYEWFKPQHSMDQSSGQCGNNLSNASLLGMLNQMSSKLEVLTGRVAKLECGHEFQQQNFNHNGVKVKVNPSLDLNGFIEPQPIKSDQELDDFAQRLVKDSEFKSKMTTYLSTRCTKGSSSTKHFGLARSVLSTILSHEYIINRCSFSQKEKTYPSKVKRKLLNHIVPLKSLMLDVFNSSQPPLGAKIFSMMHVEKGMQEYFKRLRENSRKMYSCGDTSS